MERLTVLPIFPIPITTVLGAKRRLQTPAAWVRVAGRICRRFHAWQVNVISRWMMTGLFRGGEVLAEGRTNEMDQKRIPEVPHTILERSVA